MRECAADGGDAVLGSERPVRFSRRLLIYMGLWVLTALAWEILFSPLGNTEIEVGSLEQRLWLPLYTPLMAWYGLTYALLSVWPWSGGGGWAALMSCLYFLGQAIFTLTPRRPLTLVILTSLQVVILALAVRFWIEAVNDV